MHFSLQRMSRTCDHPQWSHFMPRIFIIIFLIQAIYHEWHATSDARDTKRGWITSCVKVGGSHSEKWMLSPTYQQFPQQNGWRDTDTKIAGCRLIAVEILFFYFLLEGGFHGVLCLSLYVFKASSTTGIWPLLGDTEKK